MGKVRDDVLGRAIEAGKEQLDKVKSTVKAGKDSLVQEADKEGLSMDYVKDGFQESLEKIQRAGKSAIESAKGEADRQGIMPK